MSHRPEALVRRASLAAILLTCLAAGSPASAQPTNPGFERRLHRLAARRHERGDRRTGPAFSLAPTEGVFQAVLNDRRCGDRHRVADLSRPARRLRWMGWAMATRPRAPRCGRRSAPRRAPSSRSTGTYVSGEGAVLVLQRLRVHRLQRHAARAHRHQLSTSRRARIAASVSSPPAAATCSASASSMSATPPSTPAS